MRRRHRCSPSGIPWKPTPRVACRRRSRQFSASMESDPQDKPPPPWTRRQQRATRRLCQLWARHVLLRHAHRSDARRLRRARPVVVGGLLIALAVGRPLGAQGRATGEIGLSLLRFPDDSVTVLAPSARAWLTRETERWLASASAGGFAAAGGAGGSVDLATEWRAPLASGWRGDVGG